MRIWTIGLIVLILTACSSKEKSPEELMKKWETFETGTYSIQHPASWLVNQSGFMGTSFLIISKQTSIRDFYQENVRLVETRIDSTIQLDGFVAQSKLALEDTIIGLTFLKDTLIEFNALPCQWLVYEGKEGLNNVTTETYYFLHESTAFELTFSGKSLEMGRYRPIGEAMMNSFLLK